MQKSSRSRAEQQFAATQKKDRAALKEKEMAEQARAEHVAHLKSLRLARDAENRKAAEEAAAAKAAAKTSRKLRVPKPA